MILTEVAIRNLPLSGDMKLSWNPDNRTVTLQHERGATEVVLKPAEVGVIIRPSTRHRPDISTLLPPKDPQALVPWRYGFVSRYRERWVQDVKTGKCAAVVQGGGFIFTFDSYRDGLAPATWAINPNADVVAADAMLANYAELIRWR